MSKPKIERVLEDTDADGNRGRYFTYITCSKCGDDLVIGDDCSCGEEIDWERDE